MRLTDRTIAALKPKNEQYAVYDDLLPNFGARVGVSGSVSFFVLYTANGLKKRITIGRYPLLPLSEARQKARELLHDAKYGPTTKTVSRPFPDAVAQYLATRQDSLSKDAYSEYKRYLTTVFSFSCLVEDVSPAQILNIIDSLKGQSTKAHAYRALKTFFNWCIEREYCSSNPLAKIKKPNEPTSRERVLSDDELAAIWHACEDMGNYGAIVRLLMLTGQRANQIASLQTAWVHRDAYIEFPGTVMKNGRPHFCPIQSLARYVLMRVQTHGGYYFSPPSAVGQPFSAWSKNKVRLDAAVNIDPWCIHDLRRTWASNAPRLDIPPHVTSRVLSHTAPEGKIAAIYNKHRYRSEIIDAMQKMNTHILHLIAPDTTSDST